MAKNPKATADSGDGEPLVLVKATAKGLFGRIIEPGDEFYVPEGTKGSWFAPVKASKKSDDSDII